MKGLAERKRVAILGATGHIGKGLAYFLGQTNRYELYLFARSRKKLTDFLSTTDCSQCYTIQNFRAFKKSSYDAVINCVGIGVPAKLKQGMASIFRLTETFDNLVLDYLAMNPNSLYVNFSSGAAYGTDFESCVDEATCSSFDANRVTEADCYGIAKLNSEAKHRALKGCRIVDLRIFGYFSRFIDSNSGYLLTDVLKCIRESKEFVTDSANIVRDYVHPRDLLQLIEKCCALDHLNEAFDVYSKKPATKFEILDYFACEYGLQYVVQEAGAMASPTGRKDNYFSVNRKAEHIGYTPQFTSMECIAREARFVVGSYV